MIMPMIPNKAVDAPAFTPAGAHSKLKMLPDIPHIKYAIKVLTKPKVYSILERNMKVVIKLPKICIK